MILVITEQITNTFIAHESVKSIVSEEDFGLNVIIAFSDGSFAEKYISAVEDPNNENNSLDTKYELFADNGTLMKTGTLEGHSES